MYQLLLHKMTPVRMKITYNCLEEDPKAPFHHNCLRYYHTLKFKHPFTYTLYAHVYAGTLQVCKSIYKLHVVPPFLRNIPNPPPHNPRLNDPGHSVLPPPPLQNFVADENKYFGIEIPENKFSVRAHSCWKKTLPIKFFRPNKNSMFTKKLHSAGTINRKPV